MPFNKTLFFKPTELGHITQFPTFDTKRGGIYTPKQKQMKKFWDNIINAAASNTVLTKTTRTNLTHRSTVRIPDPGIFERFLSLDDTLFMDPLLTSSFFVDKFKDNLGLFQ